MAGASLVAGALLIRHAMTMPVEHDNKRPRRQFALGGLVLILGGSGLLYFGWQHISHELG